MTSRGLQYYIQSGNVFPAFVVLASTYTYMYVVYYNMAYAQTHSLDQQPPRLFGVSKIDMTDCNRKPTLISVIISCIQQFAPTCM